jgi:signal recognition particle receptor subunit beta
MPHVVAVNQFDGARAYTEDSLREALAIPASTPVLICDARDRASTVTVLLALVEHAVKWTTDEE